METVIKQAEENRSRSVGMANRFHEEYLPLKGEIDGMRREYLGLERLPELHEEEGTIISPEYDIKNTQLLNFLDHYFQFCKYCSFVNTRHFYYKFKANL